ncbi:MAG: LuxR C-terminal-related transcriptional regulator, partial [Planctomycetota bacterium]
GIPARERQVLELLLDGVEPKQIARRLCIKWTTVRTYVANLRRRFGATSVQQLVVFAIRERDGNLLETRQNDDCDERERDIK